VKSTRFENCLWAAISISIALLSGNAAAQSRKPIDVDKARVVEHWTKERRAAAIPRDLVIDPRGLGYLRMPDKSLVPYGHTVAAQETPSAGTPSPFRKPTGGTDDIKPVVSDMNPANGATIGASYTFEATVTDESGVKSVTFKIQNDKSTFVNSFSASQSTGTDTWTVDLSGFTDGSWHWWVEAKDNSSKGGNTETSAPAGFTVTAGSGGGGGGGGTITNSVWSGGSAVQNAAGRHYYQFRVDLCYSRKKKKKTSLF